MTTQIINQRISVVLPETIGKYTAGRIKHVLAGKTVRDLVNSLKLSFPSASEFLDHCSFSWNNRKLLLDNEVYDGDEIHFEETK